MLKANFVLIISFMVLGTTSASANWQSYIDRLVSGHDIYAAAIIDLDAHILAFSRGMELRPDEISKLLAVFNVPTKAFFQQTEISGIKYITIAASDEIFLGKNVDGGGVVCKKTPGVMVIGAYHSPIRQVDAVNAVENIAHEICNIK